MNNIGGGPWKKCGRICIAAKKEFEGRFANNEGRLPKPCILSRTSYTFFLCAGRRTLQEVVKKSEISIGDADNMFFCSARGGFISRSVEFRLLEGKILSPVLFLDKLGWLLYSLLQKQGLINVLKIGS